MQRQRSDPLDFEIKRRKLERRVARRLFFKTMRLRKPIPDIPGFGSAAAVLAETRGELTFWVSPDLDEVDVKIAALAFGLRFARFRVADAIRAERIQDARAALEREARDMHHDLDEWVDFQCLGVAAT